MTRFTRIISILLMAVMLLTAPVYAVAAPGTQTFAAKTPSACVEFCTARFALTDGEIILFEAVGVIDFRNEVRPDGRTALFLSSFIAKKQTPRPNTNFPC